jgi:kynurenine formamidase
MRRALLVVACVVAGYALSSLSTASPDDGARKAAARPLPAGRLQDLSHAFDSRTIYWPTATQFKLTEVAEGETEGGWYYAANDFTAAEHGGTHLDAPIHFARGGDTTDEVPLSRLVGEAVVIDVASRARGNRDYLVSVRDFTAWERRNGAMPRRSIVLLRTGWDRHWPNARRYLGTAERGPAAVPKLHFPGLDADGARWLVRRRAISAVGIDTASIDYGQSRTFMAHRVLGAADVPVFENVTNLARLPARGLTVVALPMKINRGSGGPLRVIAITDR